MLSSYANGWVVSRPHFPPPASLLSPSPLPQLWKALIEGLEGVWPEDKHTHLRRGDVWAYTPLKTIGVPGSDMVPFHKLTQWLAYSMLEPIEQLGVRVSDIGLLTALSEYRNGGFMLDIGLLAVSCLGAANETLGDVNFWSWITHPPRASRLFS